MKKVLEKNLTCTVAVASNPIEGFTYIEKNKPDLILLDMEMPLMDGYQALKKLRANADTSEIPVIVCSALSNSLLIGNLMKLHITDYYVKTTGMKVLVEKVSKALASE